ncbi:MAG: DUF1501 domain-containing protein [Actinobacteria bacterium]|nr:DUF1501 domain-containing protein [Actinomycetota bacterium]
MPLTRRQFIQTSGTVAASLPLIARVGEGVAFAEVDPATRLRPRLVVLVLDGGNDALNMVVPLEDVPGAARRTVYEKVRPSIQIPREQLLRLDQFDDADQQLGFHPALTYLHGLYQAGRISIVQGVDYPNHSFSHQTGTEAWESGSPPNDQELNTGWLGRHLDRVGIGEGEIRGVGIVPELPFILQGERQSGIGIARLPFTLADGSIGGAEQRYETVQRYAMHDPAERLRRAYGRRLSSSMSVVGELSQATAPPNVNGNALAVRLLTARKLLEGDYGCEVVYLRQSGYDTHNGQASRHQDLYSDLSEGIRIFYEGTGNTGPMPTELADRTLFIITSEFGRRIGENGSGAAAGTDHGAAAPVLLIGPPPESSAGPETLTPGLYGDHPPMGTPLAPADNLAMTQDMRRVYQSVLTSWLGNPEPYYGSGLDPLPALFGG